MNSLTVLFCLIFVITATSSTPVADCSDDFANCGANQTFVHCTFKCPQVMCPKSDKIILCKPPRDCPGGCGCKPDYKYNANGECVLPSDCPSIKCTRPNEEYVSCQPQQIWELCQDRYNSPPFVAFPCNPRCTCITGYYKDSTGKCIPRSDCPP